MWRQPGVLLASESFMGPLREIASRYLLIIVDVLSGAWSGNENEAAEIVPLYRKIQGVIRIGPTVLLLHHNVKPTAETIARKAGFNIRGSSALYGGLDDSISLSQVKDSPKSLVTVETRAGRPVPKFEVSWPGTTVDRNSGPLILGWALEDERATIKDVPYDPSKDPLDF